MQKSDWNEVWESGSYGFHRDEVHRDLCNHYNAFIPSHTAQHILVPLCGKTLDMMWLYRRGHHVVGVEFIASAVDEFFAENNLEAVEVGLPAEAAAQSLRCVSTPDARLRIYISDIFAEPLKGLLRSERISRVWDRAALVAVNPGQRGAYIDTLLQCVEQEVRFYLHQRLSAFAWSDAKVQPARKALAQAAAASIYRTAVMAAERALNTLYLSVYAPLYTFIACLFTVFYIISSKVRILFTTLSYDQSYYEGPPHSVPSNEIARLFPSEWDVKLLEEYDGMLETQNVSFGVPKLLAQATLAVRNGTL